ncbi:MAG: alpha/beta fold hydrolase [Bacillota bacterium]|nr:alpha/beta fold hydrolase [Bacillota bacterium]
MEKYLDINRNGYSIRGKWYVHSFQNVEKVLIFFHGFGGHKDNNAFARFANSVLSKHKKVGLFVFDLPAHGNDALGKLNLKDCDAYIDIVLSYLKEEMNIEDIYAYGNSFGGYLLLKYIHEHDNPFKKIVLRSPAVCMAKVLMENVLTEEDKKKLEKGKDVLIGFDRKVKINKSYLEDVKQNDVQQWDYIPFAEDILVAHGKEDEIVNYENVYEFCDNNIIELISFEGVEHRFRNQTKLDECHSLFLKFLEL